MFTQENRGAGFGDTHAVEPKRILVTGGAGFLGSHICERLAARGDRIICFDDFSSGDPRNVDHLRDNPLFQLIKGDVVEPIDFEIDQICNLACPASPPFYQFDPLHTFKTSVIGGMNVLELATRTKARVLHTSTSEVYGDPEIHPQSEAYWGNVNPIGPRACYDEGKRAFETLSYIYRRRRGVDVRVARIFNTYGPRMRIDDGRAISNFIVQALCGNAVTIYGDGSQTRSFCYVDDMIEGLVRLMEAPDPPLGPVNLGNPTEFTIREVAEIIIKLAGSKSYIDYRPLPIDDPRKRRPDIDLAKRTLDWTPRVPLLEGLRRTVDYFDKLLASSNEPLEVAPS